MSIRGDCRVVVTHDDVREQGHNNGRATSQAPSVCRVGCLFEGECRVVVAADDEREQGCDNGRATDYGATVVAAFEV